ncbi:IQ domain-containing protein IQM6-like [Neltuma alba]|uniref:IQ domain-containing protein IQM6-like n=1 Tax=Neltuma alba TaxID=207710 RepID=UPI0010A4930E|nr:IQ domain-containing protein IQM6-like [Prosopis alba]
MILESALNLKGQESETAFSFKTPKGDAENDFSCKAISIRKKDNFDDLSISTSNFSERNLQSPLPQTPYATPRDKAATKLQKVYKSFRTRRQLADCAVLAEQRWWRVLDFAELRRSSISFFDHIEKPETALSRWSRARTRAAKVGKGLSKDEKARKLALQHWLEAIDPRHRYGHNLQFYYARWLRCDSDQPFFYWLDIGQGKEINHERCPRSKLQQQCIKYLGPVERKAYEVAIENGRLFHKQNGKLVETRGDAKWIFVLSTSKTLYIGQKIKGKFQHSSFLAGGATLSAGRLVVEGGVIKAVWAHSGHYLPTQENFQAFLSFLIEHGVDLTDIEENPGEDDEEMAQEEKDLISRGNSSLAELPQDGGDPGSSGTSAKMTSDLRNEDSNNKSNSYPRSSRLSGGLRSKLSALEIPRRDNVSDIFGRQSYPLSVYFLAPDSLSDGYETAEDETAGESYIDESEFMVSKSNLFVEHQGKGDHDTIPREKIMKRIDSHKSMKSYQLAHQLSTKWTTGAGPRIGCMRDYPSELQFRILEHQNLSPRTRSISPSPRVLSSSRFSQKP